MTRPLGVSQEPSARGDTGPVCQCAFGSSRGPVSCRLGSDDGSVLPGYVGSRNCQRVPAPGALDILPLLPLQEELLFHSLYDASAPDPYIAQVSLTLEGHLAAEHNGLSVPNGHRSGNLLRGEDGLENFVVGERQRFLIENAAKSGREDRPPANNAIAGRRSAVILMPDCA